MKSSALFLALSLSLNLLTAQPTLGDPAPDLKEKVTQKAIEHGVPPALAHGIIRVESAYNCSAKNRHSTATGIMQVVRRTAMGVGHQGPHSALKDCNTGLEIGMRYLKQAWTKARGNVCRAATLYNLGIASGVRCNKYGRTVERYAKENA